MGETYYKEIFKNDITYNSIIANGKLNDDVT